MISDPICRYLLKSEPIIAYNKHYNVGDIFMRSKHKAGGYALRKALHLSIKKEKKIRDSVK